MQSWISEAVIYQVNLRAFAAREPRNPVEAAAEAAAGAERDASPLRYLAANLDVVQQVGANVLYLMPVFPSGLAGRKGLGSPYAIRDFEAVSPEYGTREDLQALVDAVHERGMRIIMDLTPNHTSRDHVWTVSHAGYHVRDEAGRLCHDFDWNDTAKLNYHDPALRAAMVDMLAGWLKGRGDGGGFDGFRFDMAHMVNDLGFWSAALPELRRRQPGRELLFLAECYGVQRNLDLFSRGMNAAYDDDFYKCCQYGYARDADGESRVCLAKEAFGNEDFRDKANAFACGGIAAAFERALTVYEEAFGSEPADGPWLARYTDNHDEGRGLYRFGAGAARAAAILAFTAGRTLPFLLAGQEYGALNRPPIHARLAVCDKGYRGCGDGADWQPGVEFEGNLFARGRVARRAWWSFYRGLAALRGRERTLQRGWMRLLDAGESCEPSARSVVAFERFTDGDRLRVAVNMGHEPRLLRHAGLLEGDVLWGHTDPAVLPPFCGTVVRPAGG